MRDLTLWIKDLTDGTVRRFGEDKHDALYVQNGVLEYENLQNGDGSPTGYCFCNEDGTVDRFFEDVEKYVHIGRVQQDGMRISQLLQLIDGDELISIIDYDKPIKLAMCHNGQAKEIAEDSPIGDMLVVSVSVANDWLLVLGRSIETQEKEAPNVKPEPQ